MQSQLITRKSIAKRNPFIVLLNLYFKVFNGRTFIHGPYTHIVLIKLIAIIRLKSQMDGVLTIS
jgi:hypothetical protein